MPVVHVPELIRERTEALRAFHRACGTDRAQLDVSGGVDSAVLLGLLAEALGPDQIVAVYSAIDSDPRCGVRAAEAADTFGVPLVQLDLSEPFHAMVDGLTTAMAAAGHDADAIRERAQADPTIHGSFRSCLRAPVGRFANRLFGGGLRHGTGNECEDRWLRFYQKGGDGEVDTNPIAMLSKGEVFQLARGLGVPRSILTARPTPDLWATGEAHNDEDEIAAYLELTGVADQGLAFYSYVDPGTGQYTNVGLIERVCRFADGPDGEGLFGAELSDGAVEAMARRAVATTFAGVAQETTAAVLASARRAEAATRHKYNPAIPTLGTRSDLVSAGILTEALPL